LLKITLDRASGQDVLCTKVAIIYRRMVFDPKARLPSSGGAARRVWDGRVCLSFEDCRIGNLDELNDRQRQQIDTLLESL
jgi:hypothetical protein